MDCIRLRKEKKMNKNPSKKALRSDHRLVKEARDILQRQGELCKAMSKEVGFDCGWSDVRELIAGVSPYRLWKMGHET